MALSSVEYIYNGTDNSFLLNFPLGYNTRDEIHVFVNALEDGLGNDVEANITFLSDDTIRVDDPLVSGDSVLIRRIVEKDTLTVDFEAGSDVTPRNLDAASRQTLMIYQEILDGYSPDEDVLRINAEGTSWLARNLPIVGVADPTGATEAANQRYVDDTAPLYINRNGERVGVNIANPQSKLDIGGNGNSLRLTGVSADSTGGIEFYRGDGQVAAVFGTSGGSGRLGIKSDPNNVLADSHIDIEIDGNQIATFTSDARLGIGTDDPQRPLEITGGSDSIRLTGGALDTTGGLEFYRGDGIRAGRFSTAGGSGRFKISADPENQLADTHIDFEVDGNQIMTMTDTGSLGIGTDDPQRPVHAVSASGSGMRIEASGGNSAGGIEFYGRSSSGPAYHSGDINSLGSSGTMQIHADPQNLYADSGVALRVDGDTRFKVFGDGHAELQTSLLIGEGEVGNSNSDDLAVSRDILNAGMSILARDTDGRSRLTLGVQSAKTRANITHDEATKELTVQANGDLVMQAGGSNEYMRIDSATGFVGINNPDPQYRLDVTGGARVQNEVVVGNGVSGHINADELVLSNDATNVGMSLLAEDATGNARIYLGSQTAKTAAKIQHSANTDELVVQAAGALQFQTGGINDRLYIDSLGNVGIGNAAPVSTLDVTGSIAASVRAKIGTGVDASSNGDDFSISKTGNNNGMSILTADDTGNARIYLGSQLNPQAARLHHSEGNSRLFLQAEGDLYFQTGGTNDGMILNGAGDLAVIGALSKGSGSFKIDHPLKPETHHLVHSFVEGPQADNIYRGRVALEDGFATVNLDEAARMTEGTFTALNGNVQCFTSNEEGWTAVRGKVEGNILTIEAQTPLGCNDVVSWMVIGERHDQHMLDTGWTDAAGRVITEPEKIVEDDE